MSAQQTAGDTDATAQKFEKILNFRDVGATVNSSTQSRLLKEGVLFRSARPDNASLNDRRQLTDGLGIKTVIDLRSKSEHINQAKKRNASIASSAVIPQSDAAITSAIQIPGLEYAMINLNGGGFERALLWKLSWSSLSKLLGLMALGYRTEAIHILGSEVMRPRGLTGLGIDTLEHSGKEIRAAFTLLGERASYPLMIHCTQGKDRTGLIVLLVLMLADVPLGTTAEDYLRSETELQPEREERMKEIEAVGLSEEFAGCPKDFVEVVAGHIEKKYGGVRRYLASIGVGKELQGKVLGAVTN